MAPLKCCLNCILLNCSFIIWSFCSSQNHLTSPLLSPHILYPPIYTLFLTLTFVSSFSPCFLKFCLSVFVPSGSSCPEGLHVRLSQRATCSTLLFQPLDLVKTRLQTLQNNMHPGWDTTNRHACCDPLWTVSRHKPAVRLVSLFPWSCLVLDVKSLVSGLDWQIINMSCIVNMHNLFCCPSD